MKKTALLITLLGLSLLTQSMWGQVVGYVYQSPRTIFTTVTAAPGIRVIGTTAAFHQLTWNVTGTVATCQIQVDSSADGTSWSAGAVIGSTLCTSNGQALSVSTVVNYVRINVTAISGAGATVTATLSGYANNPSGGGGTTINPTNNVLPKRSNATTFADSALTDNGTTVVSTETIQTIGGTISSTPVNGVQIGGATPGVAAANSSTLNIQYGNGAATGSLVGNAGASQFWNLSATASGNTVAFGVGINSNDVLIIAGLNKSQTIQNNAAVVIGSEGGNNGQITSTSGTSSGINFGNGSSGNQGGLRFAPTSGTANFNAVSILPQINQTGGANGIATGLLISPTETAVGSVSQALDVGTGGTGGNATIYTGGLSRFNNACRVTVDITLTVNTDITICTWSLPATAKAWAFQCRIPWVISAGTGTNTLAIKVNPSQTPTGTTGAMAEIKTSNANAATEAYANFSTSGATTILTSGTITPAATVFQSEISGTVLASATAGTFAIVMQAAGTTATAAAKAGATCWLY